MQEIVREGQKNAHPIRPPGGLLTNEWASRLTLAGHNNHNMNSVLATTLKIHSREPTSLSTTLMGPRIFQFCKHLRFLALGPGHPWRRIVVTRQTQIDKLVFCGMNMRA
jgi:hypothetical protein